MSKRGVKTPRDGVRSHCITEENVYLTFAHCYYQKLLLTPSVGFFFYCAHVAMVNNGGFGNLRAQVTPFDSKAFVLYAIKLQKKVYFIADRWRHCLYAQLCFIYPIRCNKGLSILL